MNGKENKPWGMVWLLLPIFLYYIINNTVVFVGMQGCELWIGLLEQRNEYLEVCLKTGISMAGMFLGGISVYPFFKQINERSLRLEKKYTKKQMLETVITGIFLGVGLNLFFLILGFTKSSEAYEKVANTQFAVPIWLAVIFYGILAPVVEEMVFRGILYRELKQNMGKIGAMVGSALFFGAFHGNIVQMVYGTIMGIFLAIYYEKYGTIAAPILFHGGANIIVYILSSHNF